MSGASSELAARRVLVRGRVQGVAFRYFTAQRARSLGLAGWVRNLADGRVEVHVEGRNGDVQRMVAWLHAGPPAARVDRVEVESVAPEGADGFEIVG